jgi:hypothetical protein
MTLFIDHPPNVKPKKHVNPIKEKCQEIMHPTIQI